MRNYVAVITALFLLNGYVLASDSNKDDMSVKPDTSTLNHTKMLQDYVMMKNSKMYVVIDGIKNTLDSDMTLLNGTVMMKDGTYRLEDGTIMKMKEGEKMDMDGDLTD
ncbi:MAG: DUF6799 domain-containing protein [Endomicrobiales bacterium]|jgi:hypothetical protein